jgi:hypothetical protein
VRFQSAFPLAVVYALGIVVLSVLTFRANFPDRDFAAFYLSISDYWTTGSLYAPHVNQNLNPPHASVVLFTPLILLPMAQAAVAWFICSTALIGLSLAIIRRELQLSNTHTAWLTAVLFASSASQHNLDQGQVGAVLMLLYTLAWRSARHDGSSAAWLALAISIKPSLGVWMFAQRWKDAILTIGIGAMVLVLGVLLIGADNWYGWFGAMDANRTAPVPSNLSIFGALIRAGWSTDGDLPWPWLVTLWCAASIGISVISWKARPLDVDARWLLWGLTAILISPIGWSYYLLTLAGPLAACGQKQGWTPSMKVSLGLLMVPTYAVFVLWVLHPMLGSLYSAAALLLWADYSDNTD